MNESDKKRLTKWLDECWHENASNCYHPISCSCGFEVGEGSRDELLSKHIEEGNRTFTEDADFFAYFNRLVELGEWREFFRFARNVWLDSISPYQSRYYIDESTLNKWLLSRTESGHYRLCVLCAEWRAQKDGI
jgi:hypothetical protein